jgi:hypothetical protein
VIGNSTPIKNDVSNYGINLKKIIYQSPHNNSFHVPWWEKTELLLLLLERFLWFCLMGRPNVMG